MNGDSLFVSSEPEGSYRHDVHGIESRIKKKRGVALAASGNNEVGKLAAF